MMPAIHSMRLAVRPSRSALMIGMPPATAASKATITPLSCAAAKISVPCTASSALLAVTTCLPAAIASSTSVAWRCRSRRSARRRCRCPGWRSPRARRSTTSRRVADDAPARARCRGRRPCVISMPRPARRRISSWLRCRTLKVPLPTVPMPSRPTWIGFMVVDLRRSARVRACGSASRKRAMRPIASVRSSEFGRNTSAEVVGRRPVEAGALHDQHLLLGQQLVGELLVVLDRVHLRVEPREHVQRRLRLDAGDARDLGQQLVREVALARTAARRARPGR